MGDISILDELFLLNGGALVPSDLPQNDPRGEHPSANDRDVTKKVADLRPLADFQPVTAEGRFAKPQRTLTRVPASRAALLFPACG